MPAMTMQEISVSFNNGGSGIVGFNTTPDISLDWEPTEWLIVNMATDAGDDVYFSFDGVNAHGKVAPTTPIAGVNYKFRAKKLWLYTASAASLPVVVMANSER